MFYTVIGWIGMITFLAAYALVANSKLKSTGVAYNAMNVVGAAAIAYSLLPLQAWPTIALEGCFVLIGLNAICKKLLSKTAAGQ
jgi:hypothetical protein